MIAVVFLIAWFPWLLEVLAAFASKPTARCRDGSLSYSAHPYGACSHHNDVTFSHAGLTDEKLSSFFTGLGELCVSADAQVAILYNVQRVANWPRSCRPNRTYSL